VTTTGTKLKIYLIYFFHVLLWVEMELVPEGKNFRLAQENELPELLDFLSEHLPDSLKVREICKCVVNDGHVGLGWGSG
jgi:hypothetical protein